MRYVDRVAIAVCFHFVSRPLALLSQFSFCLLARGFGLLSRRDRSKKRGQKTEAMLNVFDISEDALILPVLQKSLRENYKQLNHQEIWSFSALFKQWLVARKRPQKKEAISTTRGWMPTRPKSQKYAPKKQTDGGKMSRDTPPNSLPRPFPVLQTNPFHFYSF